REELPDVWDIRAAIARSPTVRTTMAPSVSSRVNPRWVLNFLLDFDAAISAYRNGFLTCAADVRKVESLRARNHLHAAARAELERYVLTERHLGAAKRNRIANLGERRGAGSARRFGGNLIGVVRLGERKLIRAAIVDGCLGERKLIRAAIVDGAIAGGFDGAADGADRGTQAEALHRGLDHGNGHGRGDDPDGDDHDHFERRKAAARLPQMEGGVLEGQCRVAGHKRSSLCLVFEHGFSKTGNIAKR